MKKKIYILSAIVIVLIAGALYGLREYNRGQKNTASLEVFAEKTVKDIVTEFEADEIKSNNTYNDKVLSVEGKISKIELDTKTIRVILSDDPSAPGVICEFSEDQRKKVEALGQGQTLKVKGVCTGFLMDVVLVRCVFNS